MWLGVNEFYWLPPMKLVGLGEKETGNPCICMLYKYQTHIQRRLETYVFFCDCFHKFAQGIAIQWHKKIFLERGLETEAEKQLIIISCEARERFGTHCTSVNNQLS